MALDVYVMPFWRFKVGDFTSPIEAVTGLRPKIVISGGIIEKPKRIGLFAKWKAKRQVRAIRRAVERANHKQARWIDEGGVVFKRQGHYFEALRAFAKWLDCRDKIREFVSPPEGNYYNHEVWDIDVELLTCPHLVEHDCYSGYFLPCDFETMVHVEPYQLAGHWSFSRPTGSSPQLLRELDIVQSVLLVPDEYDHSGEDPLFEVKSAYLQLREVAEISCRNNLPVIFWG